MTTIALDNYAPSELAQNNASFFADGIYNKEIASLNTPAKKLMVLAIFIFIAVITPSLYFHHIGKISHLHFSLVISSAAFLSLVLFLLGIRMMPTELYLKKLEQRKQLQHQQLALLFDRGIREFAKKHPKDATQIITKEELLDLFSRCETDEHKYPLLGVRVNGSEILVIESWHIDGSDGREREGSLIDAQNPWGLTKEDLFPPESRRSSDSPMIHDGDAIARGKIREREKFFLDLKQALKDVAEVTRFAQICDEFQRVDLFKGHMDHFFDIVDGDKTLRNNLKDDLIKEYLEKDFHDTFIQSARLKKRIDWSFLELIDLKDLKNLFYEFLEKNRSLQDCQIICSQYWDIISPWLKVNIISAMDKNHPDPQKLMELLEDHFKPFNPFDL